MSSLGFLLLAVCLVGNSCAGPIPEEQTYFLARKVLEGWNTYLKEKSLLSWEMGEKTLHFLTLFNVDLKSRVDDFSTLALRGDRQFIDKIQTDTETVHTFDFAVGFDKLEFYNEYSWKVIPFTSSGKFVVSVIGTVVRVRGTVSRREGSCSAVLESAHIQDLGAADVDFQSSLLGFLARIAGYGISFALNTFVPSFQNNIDARLQVNLHSQPLQQHFSQYLCQAF